MEPIRPGGRRGEQPCVVRFACPAAQGTAGAGTDHGPGLGCGAELWGRATGQSNGAPLTNPG